MRSRSNYSHIVFLSGLWPGLTLAQGFLEDQWEEGGDLDEGEGTGGCWGDREVGEFVVCVG